MLPLLGILGLKARDIVGYSALQFAIHVRRFCSWCGSSTTRFSTSRRCSVITTAARVQRSEGS
jgi:hypothetical protein